MYLRNFITIAFTLLSICEIVFGAGCIIQIEQRNNDPKTWPLILKALTGKYLNAFYMPDQNGQIHFNVGQKFTAACPGSSLAITSSSQAEFTCSNNNKFQLGTTAYDFKDIRCTKIPEQTIKQTGSCLGGFNQLDIGFEMGGSNFIEVIRVCFDGKTVQTLYSVFEYYRYENNVRCASPNFKNDFISVDMGLIYVRETQQKTVNDLLGLPKGATTYVGLHGSDHYLGKGHLTAKGDYTYISHKRCTFYYVNSAPQWQFLNADHWELVENSVRRLGNNKQDDLTVVTGTHEVLQLPHQNGNRVNMYLYVKGNNRAVPIPRYIWKFVYYPRDKQGVVFVSTNSPEYKQMTSICHSICDQVPFFTGSSDNIVCCTYESFRKKVNTFPAYTVTGLLRN